MDNHNTDKKGRKLFVFSEMQTKSCRGVGGRWEEASCSPGGLGQGQGKHYRGAGLDLANRDGDTGLAKAQSGESTVIQEMSQPGGENYPQLPGTTKKAAKA